MPEEAPLALAPGVHAAIIQESGGVFRATGDQPDRVKPFYLGGVGDQRGEAVAEPELR